MEDVSELKERIEKVEKRKDFLMKELGSEKFKDLVDAISKEIEKSEVRITPTKLEDIFWYIVEVKRLNRI